MPIPQRASPAAVAQMMRDNPGMNYETASNRIINGSTTWGGYRPVTPKPGTTGGTGGTSPADQWLNDIMSGKNLPFNAQVQAAQISEQSDMNAAGEAARNGQIDASAAMGGASANDPSLQGARASNFARRQTDNQTSVRDINQKGSLMNFNAQQQAAGTLSNNQMQREGWAQEAAMQQQRINAAQSSQGGGGSRYREGGQSGGGFLQWGRAPQQQSQSTQPQPAAPQAPVNTVPPFLRPVNKPRSSGIWAGPAGAPKQPNKPYTVN